MEKFSKQRPSFGENFKDNNFERLCREINLSPSSHPNPNLIDQVCLNSIFSIHLSNNPTSDTIGYLLGEHFFIRMIIE